MLKLRQITMFRVVAHHQSLSQAAEVLGVSAPALTQNLTALESQLGGPLLERNQGRKAADAVIVLTERGEWLLQHADQLLALADNIEAQLQNWPGQQKNQITIAASQTVGNYWLPPYIGELKRVMPGIDLDLIIANSEQVIEQVVHLSADIGIVEGHVDNFLLATTHFRDDPIVLVSQYEGNIQPDLENSCWLVRETGSGTREQTDKLWHQLGLTPRQIITVNSNEAIAQLVSHGAGIALLPQVVVAPLLAADMVQIIYPQYSQRRQLTCFTHRHSQVSQVLTTFKGLLQIQQ